LTGDLDDADFLPLAAAHRRQFLLHGTDQFAAHPRAAGPNFRLFSAHDETELKNTGP